MTDKKQAAAETILCINCPRGCLMTAVRGTDGKLSVSGNYCARGTAYAVQELTAPTRVLTGLMRLKGAQVPVSVKTDRPVPKELLLRCAEELGKMHPEGPVKRGDVLVKDLLGTGCSVVATRDSE